MAITQTGTNFIPSLACNSTPNTKDQRVTRSRCGQSVRHLRATSQIRRRLLNSSSLIAGLALGLTVAVPADRAWAQSTIPAVAGGSGGNNNTPASTGAGADGTQLGYTGGTGGSAGSTGGDGGNGATGSGQIAPDSGGAGGAAPGAAGSAGQTFLVGGSGGGAGAHGYVGAALPIGSTLTGGAGGAGGGGGDTTPGNHNSGAGGGGGGGGFAAVVEGNNALGTLAASLTGGTGGAGGDASIYGYAYGGKGGAGGGGLYLSTTANSSLTITDAVQGGNGGKGGTGSSFGNGGSGAGGSAIYGVNTGGTTTLTLTNTARALGGNAGAVATGGTAGDAGPGIAGANMNIILAAGATVSAGQTSNTASSRNAIQFTGGTNSLELQGNGGTSGRTYAAIDGNVIGSGTTTLKLTGAGGTFDLGLLDPAQGLSNVTGVTVGSTGSWIVGGTAVDPAPWLVTAGTLSNSLTGAQGATLAGNTTVEGGAHLSAHAVSNASAFTIGGNLSLVSPTSILDVTLGAATSTPLIAVNGDLTLNGKLNIFNSGSMTPGLYTLFGYTGDYLGSGLTIGTTPDAEARYVISTATANRVTLAVSINGLYWNGTTTAGSGVVVGGSGTWTASSGMANWIDPNDTSYVASNSGMPALFAGTAGTVSVNNTAGAVSSQGLKFTTSGYTLQGAAARDALAMTITSGVPKINVVGDATVATIALPLTGTQGLEKTGTGKLILTGTNTFTGGTTLTGGTLQLGDGTTTGSVVGNITNKAALVFNPGGTGASYAGVISGTGTVAKAGTGKLTLTGANTYTGGTTITAGTLQLGDGTGAGSVAGNITNNAALVFNPGGITATYAGLISGSGTLEKAGTGWQTLSGNNSYSGTTTVNGGLLLVSGDTALGSATGGTVVSSGATLGLYGTGLKVAEPLTLSGFGANGSGALASFRGNSSTAGTNTVSGTITLAADVSIVNSGGVGDALNLTGTITGNGTALYLGNNSSATNTISGQINLGTGGVGINSGSWAFTNQNTYSGITAIGTGAKLTFDNSSSQTVSNSIFNAGTLALSGSLSTYTGVISGTGDVQVVSGSSGNPVVALGGVNTYSGQTRVSNGWLAIGDVNSLGSSENGTTVSSGATLNVKLPSGSNSMNEALTISGSGEGSGAVIFNGSTLAFKGAITLADDAKIMAIRLDELDLQGGITGSGKNLTLTVGVYGTTAQKVSGQIALGSGGVAIEGGEWIFSGSKSYTGMTTISPVTYAGVPTIAGKLRVNGSLAGGVTVNALGTLGGSGTTGSVTVKAGGKVAPGNSPGTLTIDGTLGMEAGSIYQVDVTPAGEHDQLIVNGDVTIANGASVEVIAQPGTYPALSTHTILTASGTISGEFSSVTSDYAFLTPSLSYNGQNIVLSLVDNRLAFATYAKTANQFGAATAAQALEVGNPVSVAVRQLAIDMVPPAFDQLSGEIHPSAHTALLEDSRFLRNAVWDHLRASAGEEGRSVWGQAIGSWGHTSGNGDAARLDRSSGGLLMGIDASVGENVRLGTVWGYGQTNVDVDARGSSGKIDSFHLGSYASGQWGSAAIRTGIAYSWQDIHTTRHIVFPGFSDTTRAGYNGGTFQAFGEAAYGVNVGAMKIEPFASLAYVRARTDGFTETGGDAKLSGAESMTDVTFGTLGLRSATSFDLGKTLVILNAGSGWRHAFGDTTPITAIRYQAGGNAFQIAGLPVTRNAATLDASLNVAVSGQSSIGISYNGQLGNRIGDHTAKASVSFLF